MSGALPEPIIIRQFWRNRSGEAVRIQLREYEGRALIDIRVHVHDAQGRLVPTVKGLSCTVRCLPDLAAGVTKALQQARALGLLDEPHARSLFDEARYG